MAKANNATIGLEAFLFGLFLAVSQFSLTYVSLEVFILQVHFFHFPLLIGLFVYPLSFPPS